MVLLTSMGLLLLIRTLDIFRYFYREPEQI